MNTSHPKRVRTSVGAKKKITSAAQRLSKNEFTQKLYYIMNRVRHTSEQMPSGRFAIETRNSSMKKTLLASQRTLLASGRPNGRHTWSLRPSICMCGALPWLPPSARDSGWQPLARTLRHISHQGGISSVPGGLSMIDLVTSLSLITI